MRLRGVQWATGNVGRAGVEGIISHPELELDPEIRSTHEVSVATSPPGIKTYLDLPLVTGRAAASPRT